MVGDVLHLCDGRGTTTALSYSLRRESTAGPTSPLSWELLDDYAAVLVYLDDLDRGLASKLGVQAAVSSLDCPRRHRLKQGCPHRSLVERHRWGVRPLSDSPDTSFEVDGLRGQHPEQDLRRSALCSHDVPPLEYTGICSSTSRSDRMGGPVGKRSDTHCAVPAGSLSA